MRCLHSIKFLSSLQDDEWPLYYLMELTLFHADPSGPLCLFSHSWLLTLDIFPLWASKISLASSCLKVILSQPVYLSLCPSCNLGFFEDSVLLSLLHWLSIPLVIFPTLYANYSQIVFSHLWTAFFWTSFIQLHASYTNLEVYRYLELSVQNRNLCFPIINLHFFLETYLSFLFSLTLIVTCQIWKIFCINYIAFPFYQGPWPLFLNYYSSLLMAMLHIPQKHFCKFPPKLQVGRSV